MIDTPLKRNSAGMITRIGFGAITALDADVLLIDEVLAVGDAAFQKKCLGKMDAVAKGGRAVLFVSHNMSAAAQLCNRGILLNAGRLVRTGSIDEVVREYVESGTQEQEATLTFPERPNSKATIRRVSLVNPSGQKTTEFFNDERITSSSSTTSGKPSARTTSTWCWSAPTACSSCAAPTTTTTRALPIHARPARQASIPAACIFRPAS
jgi:ABC-type glutathione transport system ATPase component